MKYLITFFIVLFVSACSVQTVEMAAQPTEQKFNLTDSDSDGVILARDLCPDSFIGAKISGDGCGTEREVLVRRKLEVNFDNNSYLVKAHFFPEIKGLADFMKQYPETKVTIEGHTSKQGSKELNQKLSQNRAQAVKDILVDKFAIDENRVTAIGYGFERLLLEGDDEYIHARNRRIVAEISSKRHIHDKKWTIYSVDEGLE
jgi:outer membrane protein OmpA-like peptidoglycan-associated protein